MSSSSIRISSIRVSVHTFAHRPICRCFRWEFRSRVVGGCWWLGPPRAASAAPTSFARTGRPSREQLPARWARGLAISVQYTAHVLVQYIEFIKWTHCIRSTKRVHWARERTAARCSFVRSSSELSASFRRRISCSRSASCAIASCTRCFSLASCSSAHTSWSVVVVSVIRTRVSSFSLPATDSRSARTSASCLSICTHHQPALGINKSITHDICSSEQCFDDSERHSNYN